MTALTVWLAGREWECCGDAFRVGSSVTWNLVEESESRRQFLAGPLGHEVARGITHYETHQGGMTHEHEPVPTSGLVERIEAAFWRVGPRPGGDALYPVEGSGVIEPREAADARAEDARAEGDLEDRLSFEGFIVTLAAAP